MSTRPCKVADAPAGSRSPLLGDGNMLAHHGRAPYGETPIATMPSWPLSADASTTTTMTTPATTAAAAAQHVVAATPPPPPRAPPRKLRRIAVDEDYAVTKLSCWQQLRLLWQNLYRTAMLSRVLVKLSWIDIKRRKCAYFLAFFSVVLVVTVCTAMMSVLGYMPLTLLDIADNTYGRIDLQLQPGGLLSDGQSLNYTLIKQVFPLRDGDDHGYHFPRTTSYLNIISVDQCNRSDYKGAEVRHDWWADCGYSDDCLDIHCAPTVRSTMILYAIDDDLERRAGVTGDTPLPPLEMDTIVLTRELAALLEVTQPGQRVVVYGSVDNLVPEASRRVPGVPHVVLLDLRVSAIIDRDEMKFNGGIFVSVINFATLLQQLAPALPPSVPPEARDEFVRVPMDENAKSVLFLLPPQLRERVYGSSSFEAMRHSATVWAMPVLDKLGYTQFLADMPVIEALSSLRMLTMMLSMAFAFVLLGLAALCMLLIYSMLRVGVAARVYATGIQRMVGFTRENTVALLFFNVYMFAIPGWAVGLVLGQVVYLFVGRTFRNIGGIALPTRIAASSVGWATLAAMLIPFLAACLPMYAMIRLRLCDALNMTRQHVSMVVYKLVSARKHHFNGSYFGLGIVFAVVCALLYYYLPAAFLNNNTLQMLILYIVLLCCLIIGLVFVMLNFQRMVEVVVAYVLLFWESKVVFHVMLKNLNMHRSHNTLTTIMYAVSIAFLLFVAVMFNMQLDSITSLNKRRDGADVVVYNNELTLYQLARFVQQARGALSPGTITNIGYAVRYGQIRITTSPSPSPDDPSVASSPSSSSYDSLTSVLHSIGRYKYTARSLVAVSPSFFEATSKQFLDVRDCTGDCDAYGVAGTLYLPGSANRVVMSASSYDALALTSLDDLSVLETQSSWSPPLPPGTSTLTSQPRLKTSNTFVRTGAVLASSGAVRMSRYEYEKDEVIVSMPLAVALHNVTGASALSLVPNKVLLSLRDVADASRVKLALSVAFNQGNATPQNIVTPDDSGLDNARDLLGKFLLAVEAAVLIVCLISLLSSMMTNVMRSSKDVGILLCIGMTHFQIYRVYIWEAFVLVVSSGMLGVIVGVAVAYTMQLQMSMTTQQLMTFAFPYLQVVVMVAVGFFSAILSSVSPVRYLLAMPSITSILHFYQE